MTLYHGSNVEIEAVDFEKSKSGKDFGLGFYLSAEIEQAQEMAKKKALLFGGKPTITTFEFDEEAALSDSTVNYKRFGNYCMEWGEFIKVNRENKSKIQIHSYDIVYGPIANDTVGFQLRRLNAKIIDTAQFVKEIQRMGGETYQYFFGTDKAIQYLKKL